MCWLKQKSSAGKDFWALGKLQATYYHPCFPNPISSNAGVWLHLLQVELCFDLLRALQELQVVLEWHLNLSATANRNIWFTSESKLGARSYSGKPGQLHNFSALWKLGNYMGKKFQRVLHILALKLIKCSLLTIFMS